MLQTSGDTGVTPDQNQAHNNEITGCSTLANAGVELFF
jgi:hypothetical protein